MHENNMQDKIIHIIEETVGWDKKSVIPSQKIKDLDIDSLDMYEIVLKIEEITGIEIGAEQVFEFETISDIIDFIKEKGDEKI